VNLSTYANSYYWSFQGASPGSSTAENPANICYNTPGDYNVTLIAMNSNSNVSLTLPNFIHVFPSPPPQAILQIEDTLFAINGASLFQWYYYGNAINGATDYFYVATVSGNYSVIATDTNGCEVEAVINNVVASAQSVPKAFGSSLQLAIFPNPVVDEFTIHDSRFTIREADEISIYNVVGEKVYRAVHCQPCRTIGQQGKLQTVNC